jgi:tetratricopeptide (TPR) repeat protein
LRLLEAAEAESASAEPGMRAWALLQIARAYSQINKEKALDACSRALAATRELANQDSSGEMHGQLAVMMSRAGWVPNTRAELEQQILQEMTSIAPERSEQLLNEVSGENRRTVLLAVLRQYEKAKNSAKELELLDRVAAEGEMPYGIASRMISSLPSDDGAELSRIFLASLASYQYHAPHTEWGSQGDDFPTLLVRHWKKLPRALVRQAIDEILTQADSATRATKARHEVYSVLSPSSGAASFSTLFEFRLFQVLPILREIDSTAAEQYLKKYREVAETLKRYPNGGGAFLDAQGGSQPASPFSPRGDMADAIGLTDETPAAEKILANAKAGHAGEAVTQVAGISNRALRAQCYQAIAHATVKSDPSASSAAVGKLLETAEAMDAQKSWQYFRSAAALYLELDDKDTAKRAVLKGLKVAHKLYKEDSNADDPNTAIQAFWPSTNAYCALVGQAARISPEWALTLLRQIDAPEAKIAAELGLAGSMLHVPSTATTAVVSRKSGTTVSRSPAVD